MTFCTQCGTENEIAGKYCRECGKRLETPDPSASDVVQPAPSAVADATPVGDLLYDAFQLYEMGEYDQAVSTCRQVLVINPQSSSAHTLLAMVFEKRGNALESLGDPEAARLEYQLAISEREKILKMSPGSVVDSEKLKELKRKLQGDTSKKPDASELVSRLKDAVAKVPRPVLLAAGTTVVVFLVILLLMGGDSKKRQVVSNTTAGTPQQPQTSAQGYPGQQQQYPSYSYRPPQQRPDDQDDTEASDTMPFTSPGTPGAGAASAYPSGPSPVAQTPSLPVPKLPNLAPKPQKKLDPLPNVEVVPLEQNDKPQASEPKVENPAARPQQPDIIIEQANRTGGDYQREAIKLYNEGRKSEAAGLFSRAIEAYSMQSQKGNNPEAAQAGIRTCKMYLQMIGQ